MVNTKKSKNKKILTLSFVTVVALTVGVFAFIKIRDRNKVVDTSSQTTSTTPTAQSNFTGGNDRTPDSTDSQQKTSNIVEDNKGKIPSTPAASSWSTSESGEVTVYSPSKDGLLKAGDLLTGKSSAKSVNFRLIDNLSGVISEGQITVVSGKFSGKFSFSTKASQGRLDVFLTKSDGTEYGNVAVDVRFK